MKRKLSNDEKIAISCGVVSFAIILVSSIFRLLTDLKVIKVQNGTLYIVLDCIFLFIAAVCLVIACIYEKKIRNNTDSNDKSNKKENKKWLKPLQF